MVTIDSLDLDQTYIFFILEPLKFQLTHIQTDK